MNREVLSKVRARLTQSAQVGGARLPPERTLASELAITRAELRKALSVLETEGRLSRQVGRGTFLSPAGPAPDALVGEAVLAALAERTGPHEAMIARLVLEPELARLAALHATPRQIAEARRLAEEMRTAPTWENYEDLDWRFHDLIAEGAGNPLLRELYRIVNAVRQAVVWRHLSLPRTGPPADYHSFDEHDAIVSALERRDRAGAKAAMRSHIDSTLSTMTSED